MDYPENNKYIMLVIVINQLSKDIIIKSLKDATIEIMV